jgi:hypothetical protein
MSLAVYKSEKPLLKIHHFSSLCRRYFKTVPGALVQRFPGSRLVIVTSVSGVIYANIERIEKKPIRG